MDISQNVSYVLSKELSLKENPRNLLVNLFEIFLNDLIDEDIIDSIEINPEINTLDSIYLNFEQGKGYFIYYAEINNEKIKNLKDSKYILSKIRDKMGWDYRKIRYLDDEETIRFVYALLSLLKFVIDEYNTIIKFNIMNKIELRRLSRRKREIQQFNGFSIKFLV